MDRSEPALVSDREPLFHLQVTRLHVDRGLIELTDGTMLQFGGPSERDGSAAFVRSVDVQSLQNQFFILRLEVQAMREGLNEMRLVTRSQWAFLRDVARNPNPPVGPFEPPFDIEAEPP